MNATKTKIPRKAFSIPRTAFSRSFGNVEMPAYAHTPQKYTGPDYDEILRMRKENVS